MMNLPRIWVIWSSIVLICILSCNGGMASDPVVTIGQTNIRGRVSVTKAARRRVYAFRSIYYAEPPVGNKRFAAPSPLSLPPGDYDATDYGPLCPQDVNLLSLAFSGYPIPSREPSEDCLHLNIYTPTLDTNSRLAVMVWIHGGAFGNGGNALYDGSALAESQNVVVVNINYRLGPLGFLSLQNKDAKGNYGLLDQQLALKWVQNNIIYFGGDPDKVTIFGESAGGMSTSVHLIAPSNKKLFKRVITQSGPATSSLMLVEEPAKWANYVAQEVGCTAKSSEAVMSCLRSKSADELVHVKIPETPDKPLLPFGPVIDGEFIREDPMILYQSGFFGVKADVLIGFNDNEGGYSIPATRGPSGLDLDNFSVDVFRMMLKTEFSKVVPGDTSELISHVEALYAGEDGITDETAFQKFGHIVGDGLVVAPSLAIAEYTSESGYYTFVYEYQHRPSYYKGPDFIGADHGVEEPLVLGFPFLEGDIQDTMEFTEEEESLSDIMMTYWGNFAKFGDPNGDKAELPYWPPYRHTDKIYMQLKPVPEIAGNLKPNIVMFWNRLFSSAKLMKTGRHGRAMDEL
ncbi:Pyrethroid hydrolase Ces2e [Holothuria leucospilota]|uniref:Carboxylic ester hydrolase n=1 Tax=Holothuria leucospilota TaxID=206669 RepID=A0A9Q1CL60_HOLLE|nr:Pyrethroid hydrolase Ces2e [Holothuria leucospilota]